MNKERAKITVRGTVQGVGFRPFVYKLATELALNGWVLNSSQGVAIEIEGPRDKIEQFRQLLETEKPTHSAIHGIECSILEAIGHRRFRILESDDRGSKTACIPPDLAMCPDCLREMFDPHDRRHLYPFTNCTNCGPRFSIIDELPYDRRHTSMKNFTMCRECEAEYNNPLDRRFHAQPNACPKCGPQIALWDETGKIAAKGHEALLRAAEAIQAGKIVAFKALGGFQLMVDARNDDAVQRLRERKRREEKPFALMYPKLTAIQRDCTVSEAEARLLLSSFAPIVLLERLAVSQMAATIAPSVAPRNPMLGAMLPSTPLHHLLMRELDFPIVATSGNLSSEPICIDEHEALERLHGIADCFLVHDRPIVRHVDDSIARVMLGREQVLRRARGYAPMPIRIARGSKDKSMPSVLAVGAQLKSTIALNIGEDVFVSQHIGDLEADETCATLTQVATDLQRLYRVKPQSVARDTHPDYFSSRFAEQMPVPEVMVQHHYAHVLACMAENELRPPVLGVAWDGTGLGTDNTIWGGEFLLVNETGFERVSHLRRFRLPGGDAAIREPRRSALGLLHEIFGGDLAHEMVRSFTKPELDILRQMLDRNINAPVTTSAGRLFDAVASLTGLRHRANFEGQAAMELEFAIQRGVAGSYPFDLAKNGALVVDWEPMVFKIFEDLRRGERVGFISAKFHNTLAEMIVRVSREIGVSHLALSGGCFQNRYLTERTVLRLREEGFEPSWHQRIPTNDGGIALGQVVAAWRADGKADSPSTPNRGAGVLDEDDGALKNRALPALPKLQTKDC